MFIGINLLSRPRESTTAEDAVWSAIKDILESMGGKVMDVVKEGGFQKITAKPVFVLFPGYAHLSDGLKFVYAMVALLSEGIFDVSYLPQTAKWKRKT